MSTFEFIIAALTVFCAFLVVYHHALYPKLLKRLSKKEEAGEEPSTTPLAPEDLPTVALVMPAFNEAKTIKEKLFNLATLNYPEDKLHVHILLDGCTDDTLKVIDETRDHPLFNTLNVEIHNFEDNQGKIARINAIVPLLQEQLVAFTDVSALISQDALLLAAEHFADEQIGVVTGFYRLLNAGSTGEDVYWKQQCAQQQAESDMGAIQGAHGAFYVIRQALFSPLPADTINDDFIIPMQIVARGYKAIMESNVNALELEQTTDQQEARRRVRIAAGNLQQFVRLKSLLNPRYKQLAFMFASGKTLRLFMPHCMLIALIGSAYLAGESRLFLAMLCGQIAGYSLGLLNMLGLLPLKTAGAISYLMRGHYYNFVGSTRYLLDSLKGEHSISMRHGDNPSQKPLCEAPAARSKRIFDIMIASAALIVALPLFPLLILAIKLESRGPAIFSQVRIGRCTPTQTTYFTMYKFRSMVQDAEKGTGATLATKNDARVTRVGKFLRKTRLDEIPQLFNVLRGDMSIVGPRPERPDFYGKLESAIPFFADRTYDVLPGITGLAQVHQGYDTCIEDVRRKVGFDHSYALALHSVKTWLMMDLWIIGKTFTVMVMGRGQ